MPSPFAQTRQAAEAPPASPPRYGLLFAAQQVMVEAGLYSAPSGPGMAEGFPAPLTTDLRWQGGLQWAPEQTLGGGIIGIDCYGATDAMTTDTNPAITTADPVVVYAEDHCSTLGWKGRDFEGRARRQLEATQSYRIANELWMGTLAQSETLDNAWLTDDPKIVSGAAVAPAEALALIDIGLAHMLGGRRGMIHVSPQVLDQLATNNSITLTGQLWLSPMGNIVVADAGYPGTEPLNAAGSDQWIFGTSIVTYRLSDVQIIPGTFSDAQKIAQSMNRSINDITIYAQREVLLQWDWNIPAGNKFGVVAAETTTAAFTAL